MPAKPTTRQLNYLRTLADERGQTFASPRTSAQANAEIVRLKSQPRERRADRRRERHAIADAIQAGPGNAAARIEPREIHGYGSTARWAGRNQPAASSGGSGPARCPRPVGHPTELGSYVAQGERRLIVGQRVDGIVRVSDLPDGRGRAYLIERGLSSKAELDALVEDYLRYARRRGTIPMSAAIPID